MGKKRFAEADYERMAEMRESGMSVKRIAAEIGYSPGWVNWQCLRLGAESPKAKPPWSGGAQHYGPLDDVGAARSPARGGVMSPSTSPAMEAALASMQPAADALIARLRKRDEAQGLGRLDYRWTGKVPGESRASGKARFEEER